MSVMRVPLAALLFAVVGCTAVRPVSQPAQFIPQANPDVVVVVYKDHSQVPVSGPRISGDTLLGTWLGVGEPVVAPLSQIERIDARQKDKKRTTLLIAGVGVMAVAGGYFLAQAVSSDVVHCDATYDAGGQVQGGRCAGVLQPQ